MSTFDGVIKEYPLISIDCFMKKNENFESTTFFLSHCHKDHMKGLKSPLFHSLLESRTFSKIYLSDVSSHLLKNDYEYKHLSEYLEVLPMEEPTVIALCDKGGKIKSRVVVTLLTAGHCLGSVMFFIEGNNGNVLYTGDFRLPVGSSARLTSLHNENGCLKPLESLYIDTTFCNASCLYIPSREECLSAIVSIAEPWLSEGPNHIIYISCPYEYGYEFVFVELFKKFGVKTHVKEEKRRMYMGIKDIEDAVTSCASEARIHACALDRENFFTELSYSHITPCGFISPDQKPVELRIIKPSAMFFKTQYFTNISFVDKDMFGNDMYRVCYSTHSCLSEIRDMVHYLKPEKVYPNVVVRQTVEQILLLIQSPLESESSSLSPLGKLKSPPVHDFSSYENDSLPFFDECYEISKGEKIKMDCSKSENHALKMHRNVSVDTDYDNTEEQETMLKEEIYLQKKKAVDDIASGSLLKWHNPIVSSDEEVFGNSSLDSSVKDKCDSDDVWVTSEENNVKSSFEEEKISCISTPKSSHSSHGMKSPSQSLIGEDYGRYISDNHNILLPDKKISESEMKCLETGEGSNLKESCVTKGNEVEKGHFNASCSSSKNGQLRCQNDSKSSNLISHVSLPCYNGLTDSKDVLIEPNKNCNQCNVEMSLSGIVPERNVQTEGNRNMEHVDIKMSLGNIASENEIPRSKADKSPIILKKRKSRSFQFIKKINDSSESEDEYSFKYVVKLPDKGKFDNCKNAKFPNSDMNKLKAHDSFGINRELNNLPDFTKSHAQLNVTLNNNFLSEEKINDKEKKSVSELNLKEEVSYSEIVNKNTELTNSSCLKNMNECNFEIKMNEKAEEIDSEMKANSQCNTPDFEDGVLELDLSKPLHVQNNVQEPVCENTKPLYSLPSATTSKNSVLELNLSKILEDQNIVQESEYENDNALVSYSKIASKEALSDLDVNKIFEIQNSGGKSVNKIVNSSSSFTTGTTSKNAVSALNFDKPVEAQNTIHKSTNETVNSLHYFSTFRNQILTSGNKDQNSVKICDDKPLHLAEGKSLAVREVDLSSDEEISIIGQIATEKVKQPVAGNWKKPISGISKLGTTEIVSQVLDLSSDDSNSEISIISVADTVKKKTSTIVDLTSDDSNDEVSVINEPFVRNCKVLSSLQNLQTHGTSCVQNIPSNKPSLNLPVIISDCVNKIENGFVKFKRNLTVRNEECHSNIESRYKMQRTSMEHKSINRLADGTNRTCTVKPNNSNKESTYSVSGQSLTETCAYNGIKNNTSNELNSMCQKRTEEKARTVWEIKSLSQSSSNSSIIVEDITSSSDLEDSPSLLAPSIIVPRVSHRDSSTIANSCSYSKRNKMDCPNDYFSVSKREHCDKLSDKICDSYLKESDSTPEDLVEKSDLFSTSQ